MFELILCGRGGQGIVFLTRQIGQLVTDMGLHVLSSETHGMAVRGGSINSHLRIGPFYSSLVRYGHADFILSLDSTETANNIHYLKPDGIVVENSPLPEELGTRRIDATSIAKGLGRIQLENVVILGFATTMNGFPVSSEAMMVHLKKDPREYVRKMNILALEAGIKTAS